MPCWPGVSSTLTESRVNCTIGNAVRTASNKQVAIHSARFSELLLRIGNTHTSSVGTT